MNYYNEFDPKAAAWLRELINAGLIATGEVDERSICDVKADDLKGYTQCHFFAGIGGWSYALRLAGWPEDEPVDTCSCPCQPFSAAGANKGEADARDLWPAYFRIARERKAPVVFGEQVENAINKHGWLDRISADLEGCGYACGAAVLPAASVGAPHIRHRLFWVADCKHLRQADKKSGKEFRRGGRACGMADIGSGERERRPDAEQSASGLPLHSPDRSCVIGLADESSRGLGTDRSASRECGHAEQCGEDGRMADNQSKRLERHAGNVGNGNESGRIAAQPNGSTPETGATLWLPNSASPEFSGLAPAWNECGDGKNHFVLCRDTTPDGTPRIRRIPSEPAFFPLADGFSGVRVGLLRGAGNAIVAQVAAEFIQAYLETLT